MYKDYDAYIIRALNPNRANQPPALTTNTDIALHLQKYHYDSEHQKFHKSPNHDTTLNFHIDKYIADLYDNPQLPIWFDGSPRLPLPQDLSPSARSDLFLSQLSPRMRLVFRYDATRNIGCLVHFGYDFAELDRAPLLYLWMTARNLEQKRQTEPEE